MGQNGPKWSKKMFLLLFFANWVILSKKNNFFFYHFRVWGSIFRWFFGPFWPPGPKLRIFGKKRFLHVVSPYWPLTSCQKSEKSLEPILRKVWKTSKNPIFYKFKNPYFCLLETFFRPKIFQHFFSSKLSSKVSSKERVS